LSTQLNQVQTDLQQEKNQHMVTQNIITQAQTKLGITDLNDLPNYLNGKTLPQLINYAQVNCHVPTHADYDTIKQQRDDYQQELDTHRCSFSQICCVNGDYDKIKQQLDSHNSELERLQNELEKRPTQDDLEKKMKEVVETINQRLNLELKDPDLENLISHLHQLLKRPNNPLHEPISDNTQQEVLKVIKQIILQTIKEANISASAQEKANINNSLSCQDVDKKFQQLIFKELSLNKGNTKLLKNQRISLIIILILNLVAIVGLLVNS
jgi:hypothetical protein